jgi:hypothetical protein
MPSRKSPAPIGSSQLASALEQFRALLGLPLHGSQFAPDGTALNGSAFFPTHRSQGVIGTASIVGAARLRQALTLIRHGHVAGFAEEHAFRNQLRLILNGVPAPACQGSSESSAPPDLVRLSAEQLHRPELPEARCPVRAGGQLLFWVVMFQ